MPKILFHAIQDALKRVAEHWNLHRIRPCTNSNSPAGRPGVLYFVPELEETTDFSITVPSHEMDLAMEVCCDHDIERPALRDFVELAHLIMDEKGLTMPDVAEETLSL